MSVSVERYLLQMEGQMAEMADAVEILSLR